MNEEKAISLCKKDDRIAQKYIYDRYADVMLMICLRYVKHLPDAEELMQAAFLKFYNSINRFVFSRHGCVGPWLKKIMVNECLAFLRKRGRLVVVQSDDTIDVAYEPNIFSSMNASEILKLVMQLPDGYRTVFNLYAIEGYTHKEIAALTGISEGTSKSQLNRAKEALQQLIKQKELR